MATSNRYYGQTTRILICMMAVSPPSLLVFSNASFIGSSSTSGNLEVRSRQTSSNPVTRMSAASTSSQMIYQPRANLNVRLDQPLMSPETYLPTSIGLWRCMKLFLVSDVFKTTAITAILLALCLSIYSKLSLLPSSSSSSSSSSVAAAASETATTGTMDKSTASSTTTTTTSTLIQSKFQSFQSILQTAMSRFTRLLQKASFFQLLPNILTDKISASSSASILEEGVPMVFDETDVETQGWGVCSLASKQSMGKSGYVRYEFNLPRSDHILPLGMGQQLTLCCLDNENNVAKGDFHLSSSLLTNKPTLGKFSIVLPEKGRVGDDGGVVSSGSSSDLELKLGKGQASIAKVFTNSLELGDEIAIKPGPQTLQYRGQYLPVTEMIYVTSGLGIVPVIEQIQTVLPSKSSSVEGISVIWINENESEFDIGLSTLEGEYRKHSTMLAVSCIVQQENENEGAAAAGTATAVTAGTENRSNWDNNVEIREAVPEFRPGNMVVVSGPKLFSDKAKNYLMRKGFPEDCICTLP